MTKEQAQKNLMDFYGGHPMLTFTIKEYANSEWMAQCNEIDGIITCGKGNDMKEMEDLMQDAILAAAGIPREFSNEMLKRVLAENKPVTINSTELDDTSSLRLFPSRYTLQYA